MRREKGHSERDPAQQGRRAEAHREPDRFRLKALWKFRDNIVAVNPNCFFDLCGKRFHRTLRWLAMRLQTSRAVSSACLRVLATPLMRTPGACSMEKRTVPSGWGM